MAFIIAIANEKGGVAKTTTTLSLGAALVEVGKEVLLIDLDAQGNLSIGLNIEPMKARRSVANVLFESASAVSVSRETSIPGLDIIPSNPEMLMAERFLPLRQNHEFILRQALREPGNLYYDYILMDCPPFLGAVTQNALIAADLLLIPTLPEFFSINALRSMLSLVQRIHQQNNAFLTYRLLITMYDRRNRTHRELAEQLRTNFGNLLCETVIDIDTKLRESTIAGLPVIYYAPKTRASMRYRALSLEMIQYAQETLRQPA
jgi:chromosome partitioning protein